MESSLNAWTESANDAVQCHLMCDRLWVTVPVSVFSDMCLLANCWFNSLHNFHSCLHRLFVYLYIIHVADTASVQKSCGMRPFD